MRINCPDCSKNIKVDDFAPEQTRLVEIQQTCIERLNDTIELLMGKTSLIAEEARTYRNKINRTLEDNKSNIDFLKEELDKADKELSELKKSSIPDNNPEHDSIK